jgi:hypothetical protein
MVRPKCPSWNESAIAPLPAPALFGDCRFILDRHGCYPVKHVTYANPHFHRLNAIAEQC